MVWNVATRQPICGSPAQHKSAGITYCLAASRNNENLFFSAGSNTLRLWDLDLPNRKIRPTDVNLGQTKRIVKTISVKTKLFIQMRSIILTYELVQVVGD